MNKKFTFKKKATALNESLRPIAQPGEKVMFKGKEASVIAVNDNEYTILTHDGLTVDCTKNQIETVGKVDTVEVLMKFDKNGVPLNESQDPRNVMVPCKIYSRGVDLTYGQRAFVRLNEWLDAEPEEEIDVVTPDSEETVAAPAELIRVLQLPVNPEDTDDGEAGMPEGFVRGVETTAEGDPIRKLFIDAESYAGAQEDDTDVTVMFVLDTGMAAGRVPKKLLKTLSV